MHYICIELFMSGWALKVLLHIKSHLPVHTCRHILTKHILVFTVLQSKQYRFSSMIHTVIVGFSSTPQGHFNWGSRWSNNQPSNWQMTALPSGVQPPYRKKVWKEQQNDKHAFAPTFYLIQHLIYNIIIIVASFLTFVSCNPLYYKVVKSKHQWKFM